MFLKFHKSEENRIQVSGLPFSFKQNALSESLESLETSKYF